MSTLHLTQFSKFQLFPSVSKIQWWVFSCLECTSSYTNKYPPKVIIFGYFLLRIWQYFCIVFICSIGTCSRYDVTELIRASLFSPGHNFKNPIFGVFEAEYLWKYLSVRRMVYSIRIVSSRWIFEKKWWLWHTHFKWTWSVAQSRWGNVISM